MFGFKKPSAPLNCGNSGTTMRLISGILSAQDFSTTLTGDASLSKRPMNRVSEPLAKMGATFELRDGKFAPYRLTGTKNIRPIEWTNPFASAQVKSAVLLAALHARGPTIYREPTVSRDHTERMLAASGANIRRDGTTTYIDGPAKIKPMHWRVPGDISSAAFFIVAALLAERSDVSLENVNVNPTRTGILDVLRDAGAQIQLEDQRLEGGEPVADIHIQGRQPLKAFHIDKTIAPRLIDEIPILAIAATQAEGLSVFSGIEELRVKETDRLKALAVNLGQLGASVKETDDGLIIKGPTPLTGAAVESFDDHRIAMSMAIASIIATGDVRIRNSQCVAISFPTFWDALQQLSHS
jgi:3-phosphoshikimate 1-carboxyvinyltransferase